MQLTSLACNSHTHTSASIDFHHTLLGDRRRKLDPFWLWPRCNREKPRKFVRSYTIGCQNSQKRCHCQKWRRSLTRMRGFFKACDAKSMYVQSQSFFDVVCKISALLVYLRGFCRRYLNMCCCRILLCLVLTSSQAWVRVGCFR